MPGVHLLIDGRQGFLLGNELLDVGIPWLSAEQGDLNAANVWLQRFPGLIAYSACSVNWMMLFDFSGLIPINSETHASTIQKAGWEMTAIATG